MPHKPVLVQETLELLKLRPAMTVVDGTLGGGGHSLEIVRRIAPGGHLIALDRDPDALERAQKKLPTDCRLSFANENFKDLPGVLRQLNVSSVDAVLLDVGFSSDQVEEASRGFSFDKEGPLDMRLNQQEGISTAADFLAELSEGELEAVFRNYGEERFARRIARAVCWHRDKNPIETTFQLAEVVVSAIPGARSRGPRPFFKRHPAMRVFQALRIAVNDELGSLQEGLANIWPHVHCGGRLGVISFHSLEDRIVKRKFLAWKAEGSAEIVTRKPVQPAEAELQENSRARSAKFRVAEKKS